MQNLIVAQGNTNPYPELELIFFDQNNNSYVDLSQEIIQTLEINNITPRLYLR